MTGGKPNIPGRETILVVDDDKAFRVATKTLLHDHGFRLYLATGGREALALLASHEVDLVLTDMVMEGMTGLELLTEIQKLKPGLPVMMVTGYGSVQTAVEAMRLGAVDYVTKPHNNDELLIKIERALLSAQRDRTLESLRNELAQTYSYGNIISRSEKMRTVLHHVRDVANTDVTVLVQGESGTGKELVARALHFNSRRSGMPFVTTNCSALTESLLESELFGHEKGAFTGALVSRRGRFEEAHGGTLFLDEIGDISPTVQKKLLRVLQEKVFERVGGNTPIAVETRVVVATNRCLEAMVREGDFREDLYYRLNVFPITLPPLRERLEDIPLLAEHFLHKHAELSGGTVKEISPAALAEMMNYSWRGNIRELENLVKRAIIKTPGDTITSLELPVNRETGEYDPPGMPEPVDSAIPYKEYLNAVLRNAEATYLVKMLRQYHGNVNLIARHMDIDRKTVYRKLADCALDPSDFRE